MRSVPVRQSYPESVLHFDDGAVEDGGLCIMGNIDDPHDVLIGGWRNGLSHFFQEVFGVDSSFAFCKEAMLPVYTVLGLDLPR